jgi:hypothetical protein
VANIFDQLEQAAARGGASEPFNYAMDRVPSMEEAAGGGAYMGANYLAPETVDYCQAVFKSCRGAVPRAYATAVQEMLPTGVSVRR